MKHRAGAMANPPRHVKVYYIDRFNVGIPNYTKLPVWSLHEVWVALWVAYPDLEIGRPGNQTWFRELASPYIPTPGGVFCAARPPSSTSLHSSSTSLRLPFGARRGSSTKPLGAHSLALWTWRTRTTAPDNSPGSFGTKACWLEASG